MKHYIDWMYLFMEYGVPALVSLGTVLLTLAILFRLGVV